MKLFKFTFFFEKNLINDNSGDEIKLKYYDDDQDDNRSLRKGKM
jgi:hypothetical protein